MNLILILGCSLLILLTLLNAFLLSRLFKQKQPQQQTPIVKIDLKQIEKSIEQVPNKVLHSIVSSTNGYKGKVGELMGYLRLANEYDKVIPINDITDFICITFPKDNKPGRLVFLDIKTGESARLSQDQRKLRDIIKAKNIEFQKYSISISDQMKVDSE
jgi:predicted Holliday junction resolvase-like endonuclease